MRSYYLQQANAWTARASYKWLTPFERLEAEQTAQEYRNAANTSQEKGA